MGWYVDGGLDVLNDQMRDHFPGITIWTIGDADHSNRESDHNPEDDGSVDASDYKVNKYFTHQEAEWFFNRLITIRDPRFAYAIFNGRIVSSTVQPWKIRKYNGSNQHKDHVHVSVNDKHENDRRVWKLADKMRENDFSLDSLNLPLVKFGEDDAVYGGFDMVRRIQKLVGVTADGFYGQETANAIKRTMGSGDGKAVDLQVWRRLYGLTY